MKYIVKAKNPNFKRHWSEKREFDTLDEAKQYKRQLQHHTFTGVVIKKQKDK